MAEALAFSSYPYLDYLVDEFNAQVSQTQNFVPEVDASVRWHTYEYAGLPVGSCLFFYGNHIHDLADPQIAAMRTNFEAWNEETASYERLVRVEGRVPEIGPGATEESCIASDRGEVAWLALRARLHGIDVGSLECPSVAQAADLLTANDDICSPDLLFYYYVTRQLPQGLLSLGLGQVTPEQYVWALECMQVYLLETIDRFSHELGWKDYDFSFDNLLRIHEALYPGRQFNTMDRIFFGTETMRNMHQPSTPVQYVSRAVNLHRDSYVADLLQRDMAGGVHVFAFMGSLHAQNAGALGSSYLHT